MKIEAAEFSETLTPI